MCNSEKARTYPSQSEDPLPYLKHKKRTDPSIGAVHRTDIRLQIWCLPPIGFCIDILIEQICKQLYNKIEGKMKEKIGV